MESKQVGSLHGRRSSEETDFKVIIIGFSSYILTFAIALASSKAGATKLEWLTMSMVD